MSINNLLGYIDPATTAIIWQVLVGFFVATGLVFAIWWRKITTFVRGLFVRKSRQQKPECNSHNVVWGERGINEVEAEIEKLNEDGVRDITITVKEMKPEYERLAFKYGVEFITEEEASM